MKIFTIVALLGMISTQVFSKDIFLATKNILVKNVLHYDVKVDNCQLANKGLNTFWIMGASKGQRAAMTKDESARFAPVILRESDQEIEFTLPVFNEMNNPIANNPILVKMVSCKPKAYVKINGQSIELNEVYAHISLFKMCLKYLLIKGKKINGADFSHRIDA